MIKKIIIVGTCLIVAVLLTALIAILMEENKTNSILEDFSSVYQNKDYAKAVHIEGIQLVKQEISCGYAVIEMFSNWAGGSITEESLFAEYGSVVTSTGKSFEEEMNKRFSPMKTTMYSYLPTTEMLDKIYRSLESGVPVPFEWAAQLDGEWTLHYSLITGLDVANDKITVLNPYGYEEQLTLKEFVDRTGFRAYESMPIFFKLAFAFGFFERNTIFVVETP